MRRCMIYAVNKPIFKDKRLNIKNIKEKRFFSLGEVMRLERERGFLGCYESITDKYDIPVDRSNYLFV